MKTKIILIALLFGAALLNGCSPKTQNKADYLPPLQIEIPAELKGNPEVVTFIKKSETAINIYSKTAEDLGTNNQTSGI